METTGTPQPPMNSTLKMILRESLILALLVFGVVIPFRMFVAEPYIVSGASMDPTFSTSDYLIVDKISYELGNPERGTVTVFKYPNDPSKRFIKRIIGLPGETVVSDGKTLKVVNAQNPNGIMIDESYITHMGDGVFQRVLGDNEYFVMGDNRTESFDSRSWGAVDKRYMVGRPVLRLYPFTEIGIWPGDKR